MENQRLVRYRRGQEKDPTSRPFPATVLLGFTWHTQKKDRYVFALPHVGMLDTVLL